MLNNKQIILLTLLTKVGKNKKFWEYFYLLYRMKILHKAVASYLIIDEYQVTVVEESGLK